MAIVSTTLIVIVVILLCNAIVSVFSDTGCTSIINGDTCIINRTSEWEPHNGNIICDDSLPYCIILCQGVLSCSDNIDGNRLSIICPSNAKGCIINCTDSRACRTTQILADTSYYTELNIKANNAGRDIYIHTAYELQINVIGADADFLESTIFSTVLSTHIGINCDHGEMCTDNTIHAQKTHESLTVSCNGLHSDCSNSNIWCPIGTCTINCTMCRNMNVYTTHGSSNIHWHCGSPYACTDSKLICAQNQDDLKWNTAHQQWQFEGNLCGQPYTSIANNTELDTVFVPNTEPFLTSQPEIVFHAMNSTSNVQGMDVIQSNPHKRSNLAANRICYSIIAISCTVSSIALFWICVERCRNGNEDVSPKDGHSDNPRCTSLGAPPPRTNNRSHTSGEYTCIIKVPLQISDSENDDQDVQSHSNDKEVRYNHVRIPNILNAEFMKVKDSILSCEGDPDSPVQDLGDDVDDLKCAELDGSETNVTPTPAYAF
eukprot:8650_1